MKLSFQKAGRSWESEKKYGKTSEKIPGCALPSVRIDLKKSHHNNFLEKLCDEREKDMQMKCLMFQVAVFVV